MGAALAELVTLGYELPPEEAITWALRLEAEGWQPGSRVNDGPVTRMEVFMTYPPGAAVTWWTTPGTYGGNVRVHAGGDDQNLRWVSTTTTCDAALAHARLLLAWQGEDENRRKMI